jgi:hypothetical protein
MKLIKILTSFIALASLQIAAAQWLNVPPPAEAKNLMIFTAGVPVVGGCSASTESVGTKIETGTAQDMTGDYLWCSAFTPTCSGNLNTAYIYHGSTATDLVKVVIYNKAAATPGDAGDTLVYASGEISSSSVGWASTAVVGTYPVSTGSSYWVCSDTDGSSFNQIYNNATSYYGIGTYTSIPATMEGISWTQYTRTYSMYFSIGN